MDKRGCCAFVIFIICMDAFKKIIMYYGSSRVTASGALAGGIFAAGIISFIIGVRPWRRFIYAVAMLVLVSCAAYLLSHYFQALLPQ
jgi:hypothetical protein